MVAFHTSLGIESKWFAPDGIDEESTFNALLSARTAYRSVYVLDTVR